MATVENKPLKIEEPGYFYGVLITHVAPSNPNTGGYAVPEDVFSAIFGAYKGSAKPLYVMYSYDEDHNETRWYNSPLEAVEGYRRYREVEGTLEPVFVPYDDSDLLNWAREGQYVVAVKKNLIPDVCSYGNPLRKNLTVVNSLSGVGGPVITGTPTESESVSMATLVEKVSETDDAELPTAKALVNHAYDSLIPSKPSFEQPQTLHKRHLIRGLEITLGQNLSLLSKSDFLKLSNQKKILNKSMTEIRLKGAASISKQKVRVPTILPVK